ncbi:hypothetical protein D3C78_1178510 [compost metagenome]
MAVIGGGVLIAADKQKRQGFWQAPDEFRCAKGHLENILPQGNTGLELAERVFHIGVHRRPVAAQPVGMGAPFRHSGIPCAEGCLRQNGARHIRAFQHFFQPQQNLCDTAHEAGIEIGIPDRQAVEGIRMADGGVKRHEAAHGMAEEDHRQAGVPFANHPAHRHDIGNDLFRAVLPAKTAERRICRSRAAMAAMVVGIDFETLLRHHIREPAIAACMVNQPVADHQHAARRGKGGGLVAKGDGCAGGGFQSLNTAEGQVVGRFIHDRACPAITSLVIIMGS